MKKRLAGWSPMRLLEVSCPNLSFTCRNIADKEAEPEKKDKNGLRYSCAMLRSVFRQLFSHFWGSPVSSKISRLCSLIFLFGVYAGVIFSTFFGSSLPGDPAEVRGLYDTYCQARTAKGLPVPTLDPRKHSDLAVFKEVIIGRTYQEPLVAVEHCIARCPCQKFPTKTEEKNKNALNQPIFMICSYNQWSRLFEPFLTKSSLAAWPPTFGFWGVQRPKILAAFLGPKRWCAPGPGSDSWCNVFPGAKKWAVFFFGCRIWYNKQITNKYSNTTKYLDNNLKTFFVCWCVIFWLAFQINKPEYLERTSTAGHSREHLGPSKEHRIGDVVLCHRHWIAKSWCVWALERLFLGIFVCKHRRSLSELWIFDRGWFWKALLGIPTIFLEQRFGHIQAKHQNVHIHAMCPRKFRCLLHPYYNSKIDGFRRDTWKPIIDIYSYTPKSFFVYLCLELFLWHVILGHPRYGDPGGAFSWIFRTILAGKIQVIKPRLLVQKNPANSGMTNDWAVAFIAKFLRRTYASWTIFEALSSCTRRPWAPKRARWCSWTTPIAAVEAPVVPWSKTWRRSRGSIWKGKKSTKYPSWLSIKRCKIIQLWKWIAKAARCPFCWPSGTGKRSAYWL